MPPPLVSLLAKSAAANLLPADLFDSGISLPRSRQLVRAFVRLVEIENHSYCNRVCSFCPNAFLDRRSQTLPLSNTIFEKILSDLASIAYDQTLIWSRYHEPFADTSPDTSIVQAIARAKSALPKAWLVAVSNGDYLNEDLLKQAEEAGLNRLMIDLYMPQGQERDPKTTARELAKFLHRTGLHTGKRLGAWDYRLEGSAIQITLGIPKYETANLSSRGGLIDVPGQQDYRRTSVCFNPLHSLVIDYDGSGMLCCQTRADAPSHREAILADLSQTDENLFTLYRNLAPARKALLEPGAKSGVCATCTMGDKGPDKLARRPALSWLSSLPGIETLLANLPRKRIYET